MRRSRQITLHALILLAVTTTLQAQPRMVTEISRRSTNFLTVGEYAYFVSSDSLMRTDGTAEGTMLLKTGFDRFGKFTAFGGMLYFVSDVSTEAGWKELWRSDGTPAGTILLKTSSEHDVDIIDGAGEYLYFAASDPATGHELYRTDGTSSGTVMVKDINPGSGDALVGRFVAFRFHYAAAAVGNDLFFAASDGSLGQELWKTDGTASGTVMVQDINPGAGDGIGNTIPVSFDNRFYFHGVAPAHGGEPWVSDGTAAGTYMLTEIVPGPEGHTVIQYGAENNGWLFFGTNTQVEAGAVFDLWKTDGSAASTVSVKRLCDGPDCRFTGPFLTYKDKLHFILYEDYGVNAIWGTDGTAEGTQQLWEEFLDGDVPFFEVVNDLILFSTTTQGFALDFFRSDGTPSGTTEFWAFRSTRFGANPVVMAKVGDRVFFADHASTAGSVPPEDAYELMQTDGWTVQPLSDIFGTSYHGTTDIVNFNGKVLFARLEDSRRDVPKELWIYDPNAPVQETASFTIVNADTDEDIQEVKDGDVFTKPADTNINIRYNPTGTPGSVVFKHQGKVVRTENAAPYALRGDHSGDYIPWTEATAGSHTIAATPYSESGGKGTAGQTLEITFTIEEEATGDCMASGTILREYWDNVQGNYVSQIPLDQEPSSTSQLTIFEGPENVGTNYGARIRGYICPPASGEYTFWIASNDHSELWLSDDDDPANKKRIAYLTRATGPREWDKFSTQQSAPVNLVEGRRYYIEALHKQGIGTDHVSVGWRLPAGTLERPIPGNRLSPFEMEMSMMASSRASFTGLSIYPNPVQSSHSEFTLSGFEGAGEAVDTEVEIRNTTGDVVFSETISCGGDCHEYSMRVDKQLAPGIYLLNLRAKGICYSKRLLVK